MKHNIMLPIPVRIKLIRLFACCMVGIVVVQQAASAQTISLTLETCIKTAREQAPTLLIAQKNVEIARHANEAMQAAYLPQVSLSGRVPDLNRSIIPIVQPDGTTLFVPQGQAQSSFTLQMSQRIAATGGEVFVSSGLSRIDQLNDKNILWQSSPVAVGIRQEIFQPNDFSWDLREQVLRIDIAERQYLESLEDISLNASNVFFECLIAKILLENSTLNVQNNDTLFTLSKGRFAVGKIAESDLLQSELAYMNAQSDYTLAKLAYDRSIENLRIILNLPKGTTFAIKEPPFPPQISPDAQQTAKRSLAQRSEMLSVELQDVQAHRRLNNAELTSGFQATLQMTAGWNQRAGLLGDVYQGLQDQQRVSLSFQVPLLQWGAGTANIQLAKADIEKVAINAALIKENLYQDAYFAAVQYNVWQRQMDITLKADTIANKRFEVAKHRYVIGKTGTSDLFIAQQEKNSARRSLYQTMRDYWSAYFRLRRLTLFNFETNTSLVPEK